MKDIFLVYSNDTDLSFLGSLVTLLKNYFVEKLKIFELDSTLNSHLHAQDQLKSSPQDTLIIILCHGGSNYILGNKNIEGLGVNDDHYEFLSARNIDIIANKKLLCLSCNSREGVGDLVVNNNGLGLIGFGDIRFDDLRLLKAGIDPDGNVQDIAQRAMIEVLSQALVLTHKSNGSMFDFLNYFKLFANKYCDDLILKNKGNAVCLRAANFLWGLKHEISLFGNGKLKLFE